MTSIFARITSYLAFAALFAAFVVSGTLISFSGKVIAGYIALEFGGRPLPFLTAALLAYANSGWPLICGLAAGVVLVVMLVIIERFQTTRIYLPFALSVGWILVFLQIGTTIVAFTLPFAVSSFTVLQ